MPRIKNTAKRIGAASSSSSKISTSKALVLKKIKNAAAKASAIMKAGGGNTKSSDGLIHTGKLKVPFKPASGVLLHKKTLIKQLKRRWVSFKGVHSCFYCDSTSKCATRGDVAMEKKQVEERHRGQEGDQEAEQDYPPSVS